MPVASCPVRANCCILISTKVCGLSRNQIANFSAPIFEFSFDRIANLASGGEFLIVVALESGWIGKAQYFRLRHGCLRSTLLNLLVLPTLAVRYGRFEHRVTFQ